MEPTNSIATEFQLLDEVKTLYISLSPITSLPKQGEIVIVGTHYGRDFLKLGKVLGVQKKALEVAILNSDGNPDDSPDQTIRFSLKTFSSTRRINDLWLSLYSLKGLREKIADQKEKNHRAACHTHHSNLRIAVGRLRPVEDAELIQELLVRLSEVKNV